MAKNRNTMSAEELKADKLLVEKLKLFMAEKHLTIEDVAGLIDRIPYTVWKFLHQKVKSHDKTICRIKKLIGEE